MSVKTENKVEFTINGLKYSVSADSAVNPSTSLNTFIRNHAGLKGTKAMCHEGGCGACIVSVKVTDPFSKEDKIMSVNSCLVSILSCHKWAITTVEGLGDRNKGYHDIQKRLAAFNGTQCGFCSPGWIMNMYSVWEASGRKLTMKETENSFAGNICRCTGYRPIIDAFKSMTTDCDRSILDRIQDIEDMSGLSLCGKTGQVCTKTCGDYDEESGFCVIGMEHTINESRDVKNLNLGAMKWRKVYTTEKIFEVLDKEGMDSYMLTAGNTAQGVYHMDELPNLIIDISDVKELKQHSMGTNLSLGGGLSLNQAMDLFQKFASANEYFGYLRQFHHHLDLVAHVPVRNIGTLAGNLMIKHKHHDFPSDVFLIFETVGAVLTLLEKGGRRTTVTLPQFLKTDMKGKIILSVDLPPLACECVVQTYKIMPRAQNAHALVNAGFMLHFKDVSRSVIEEARIVFGNINSEFIHAEATEKLLVGKNIFDPDVLKAAVETLSNELRPEDAPPEPSPEFRKKLALGLLYKFVLHIAPGSSMNNRVKTGGEEFDRPVSQAHQTFDTNKNVWPLNQPIPKIEALVQCSGEGSYINDIPIHHNEVFVAFVLSTVHKGKIEGFDDSDAMKLKGVLAFFSAKDIPGTNNFTPASLGNPFEEEILANGTVKYHGQPVGIIVADNEALARAAVKLVKVFYKDIPKTPPVLTVRDALAAPHNENRVINNEIVNPAHEGKDVAKVIKGSLEIFSQYHYTMETQICVCVPIEDGMEVYSSTQTMDLCQMAIGDCLKIPHNQINVMVRRLGGAYGSKISRSGQIACACALAAHLLNRPARMVLSLTDNMKAIGKRIPCTSDYEGERLLVEKWAQLKPTPLSASERHSSFSLTPKAFPNPIKGILRHDVGVNSAGEIQYMKNVFYQDNGISHNETAAPDTAGRAKACYDTSRWYLSANSVITDTASNTWCRAPGTTEGVAMTENIMEHIAYELGLDPVSVRKVNMDKEDNNANELIDQLKTDAEYDKRAADIIEFNKNNRWRKRGISLVPLKYQLYVSGYFPALVSIYHGDGTVSVSHGGIEMGQGLNTKVAQVCAHILGIPLSSVSVKHSDTHTGANAATTGGSVGSELCCFATMKACQILLERLEPVKKAMKDPTWEELITKAYGDGIMLSAIYTFTANDKEVQIYSIYAVGITEVELDVLTGNHQILRVDILEDTGESLSPEVDIGQVEGAFVMGLGYWTSEHLVYDKKTGELLTNRTWNYKPLGIKDIPLDFRVQFRRNAGNPLGVLRSKATGEPALNMSITVAHALRQAITAARKDAGLNEAWCKIDAPYTTENILMAINSNPKDFVLK